MDGSLVLFGGLSDYKMNDTVIFDFRNKKWTSVKFETGQYVPENRYGHTAVCYNSHVYIYGGYRRYIESFKTRDAFGDVAIFDTDNLAWYQPLCEGIGTYRRHH